MFSGLTVPGSFIRFSRLQLSPRNLAVGFLLRDVAVEDDYTILEVLEVLLVESEELTAAERLFDKGDF